MTNSVDLADDKNSLIPTKKTTSMRAWIKKSKKDGLSAPIITGNRMNTTKKITVADATRAPKAKCKYTNHINNNV